MALQQMHDGANSTIPAIQISLRNIVKKSNSNSAVIDASLKDWGFYANNVQYNGVETVIASGVVLECIIDSVLIYRFIDDTINVNNYPIEDAFYSDFDGVNLTNLLATRG
jgi:hypothetical protein